MTRLNTRKFNSIVTLFDLKKMVSFFLLYNDTPFMNGYHGCEHMKRTVCSVFELSKRHHLRYADIKALLKAAIFHDFGYLGTNKEDPEYDRKNIEVALHYLGEYYDKFSKQNEDIHISYVRGLIQTTRYPDCIQSDEIGTVESILLDADFSMVLYDGGGFHQLLYYVFDFNGEEKYSSFKENVINWSKTCRFRDKLFSDLWEKEKESIVEDTFSEVESILNTPLYDDKKSMDGKFKKFCEIVKGNNDYLENLYRRFEMDFIRQ